MALGACITFRQHRHFHTQNTAGDLLAHQSLHAGLSQRASTMGQRRLLKRRKKRSTRLTLGHHTVTTRSRLSDQLRIAISRDHFVARVVQVHAVGRVRRFVRRHGRREGRTLLFQPVQISHAVSTETCQRLIADHAIDLMLEVGRHGFGRILKARLLLVLGATTGIDHAAREHAGTTTAEAVDHQHFSALLACLNGCAGTGSTPAYDNHIGSIRPMNLIGRPHIQCSAHRINGADAFFGV